MDYTYIKIPLKSFTFDRHPLQERVLDTFVPNDARLIGGAGIGATPDRPDDEQWNSVLLCTGANACGKVSLSNLRDDIN